MNFPTETFTQNLVFSNIFDKSRIKDVANLATALTDFNPLVVIVSLSVLVIPAIITPFVIKKRKKKIVVGGSADDKSEEA